uniref:Uncharacterized protein n=1 Tax=Lactuca sativa TaxID=4236 RepID=A0A9R1V8E1_LACSA|nr:hypothetical protein LSAT_V11C600329450 [Lactuca sativa]
MLKVEQPTNTLQRWNDTDKGHLDAILVLGMLLMVEDGEMKQEVLIMLNNAYISTRRSWNLRQTCYKVRSHLVREGRSKQIQFHGLHKGCEKHHSVSRYGKAFKHEYSFVQEYWFSDKHGETSIDDDNTSLGVDDSNTNLNECECTYGEMVTDGMAPDYITSNPKEEPNALNENSLIC